MKIKFGIIGCGNIGKRHAKHIFEHEEGVLVGVYDIVLERSKVISDQYNCFCFSSFEDLLNSDVDIINICTPNGLHSEHSIQSLNSAKHVLVEKPMALKSVDCENMVHAALKMNKQLFVVKQNRYNPPVVALKKLIKDNKLGKVYFVAINCFWNRNEDYYKSSDWKGTKTLDGGTLFTQFSHFVDILYYLFGDITDIQGKTINANHKKLIDFEDTGAFTFKFTNEGLGSFNYTTSSFNKNMEGSILVFSENGTIKIGGQYLNSIDYDCSNWEALDITEESNNPNDYGTYQGSMSNHDKVIDNVINTLNGRSVIMTNAMDGMKVVDIVERVYSAIN
jgi:predicted dehydrogenase